MTEIPEHLRKRAEEARAKAAAAPSGDAPADASGPASETESKIPSHLLERSKAAKAKAAGGDPSPSTEVAASGGGSSRHSVPQRGAGDKRVATDPASHPVPAASGGWALDGLITGPELARWLADDGGLAGAARLWHRGRA